MLSRSLFPVVLVVVIGCQPGTPDSSAEPKQSVPLPSDPSVIEVTGRTECMPSRRGIIAPVPLHPVVAVLVAPGDRVKKGQALVKIDDDEAQADVRAKQAALQIARIALKESRRQLASLEKAYRSGAIPAENYQEAQAAALKADLGEQGTKAALDSARAELEHYTITASIDGVVSWLEVHPGTVSRPGTTIWGEILDLSEIDVRCELSPRQAVQVRLGQAAEIREGGQNSAAGRVVFVGIAADKASGLVPVVIRLANREGRFRCRVPVQVRLNQAATKQTAGKVQFNP